MIHLGVFHAHESNESSPTVTHLKSIEKNTRAARNSSSNFATLNPPAPFTDPLALKPQDGIETYCKNAQCIGLSSFLPLH